MSEPRHTADQEAALWVSRMDRGDWTAAQEADLQAWLSVDPRRAGALLQAHAAWLTLDPESIVVPTSMRAKIPTRREVLAYGGGAAAAAASVAGGLILRNRATRYTTDIGEIRRLPLADGSIAAINSASTVEVNLAGRRREVRIDRGEAWFQVARDPQRPFIVDAGRIRVQAIGTAFSVRRFEEGAQILVTEGVVEAWADGADGHRIKLIAGAQAYVADNAAIKLEDPAFSSVDRALAWRAGKIELAGDRLDQAVGEFNRYNRRKLLITDPTLNSEEFDGTFRIDDPEGFAAAVTKSLQVPLDMSSPNIIGIGRPNRETKIN